MELLTEYDFEQVFSQIKEGYICGQIPAGDGTIYWDMTVNEDKEMNIAIRKQDNG